MDRGAWQASVHGGCKELDKTERLSTAQHRSIHRTRITGFKLCTSLINCFFFSCSVVSDSLQPQGL